MSGVVSLYDTSHCRESEQVSQTEVGVVEAVDVRLDGVSTRSAD